METRKRGARDVSQNGGQQGTPTTGQTSSFTGKGGGGASEKSEEAQSVEESRTRPFPVPGRKESSEKPGKRKSYASLDDLSKGRQAGRVSPTSSGWIGAWLRWSTLPETDERVCVIPQCQNPQHVGVSVTAICHLIHPPW